MPSFHNGKDPLCSLCHRKVTMVINARVIGGSDPGAVPGDSTNTPFI